MNKYVVPVLTLMVNIVCIVRSESTFWLITYSILTGVMITIISVYIIIDMAKAVKHE